MDRKKFIKTSAGAIAGTYILSSFAEERTSSQPDQIIPPGLKRGDRVALTGPSGSIWNKAHIDKIDRLMANWGLETVKGQTLYEQDGFLAGSDSLRSAELMGFIEDTSVKAILTMRGGWGCGRILDQLDYEVIKSNPKIVMGFSDITSLVNAIYRKTGVITYHGPCGYSSWGDFTRYHVTKVLVDGNPYELKNPSYKQNELRTLSPGKAKGRLIGGNLTVVVSMIGTNYEPLWKNKILFLEEIGEEPYRIDRMLWQLKQRGVFNQINGVVLGHFKNCEPEEPEKSFSLVQIIEQHFKDVPFPVYSGATFGHLAPKFTLPIGLLAQIDAGRHTIRLLENTVII